MRVLVTDGDARACLAIVRSLGRLGHAVHVCAPRLPSLAGSSRYCSGELRQAGTEDGPSALSRSLLTAARSVGPDVVVGVTDATLTVLHQIEGELRPAALPAPDAERYLWGSDKVRLFEACVAAGIPVPRGVVVDGGCLPARSDALLLGAPLVVRPGLSWRRDGDRWIRGTVSYEADLDTLRVRLQRDAALGFPYLVQARVEGHGCGLFVVAIDGRVEQVFAHRRIREKPPSGGVSTLCESVEAPDDLVEFARRWTEAGRWSGLAMLEFKRRADTGQAYLLEVNARPWGSLELASSAGVDFPAQLLASWQRPPSAARRGYRAGVRLRWWWGDVDHFYLRERERGVSGARALLLGLCRAIVAGPWPDAWDTFRRDDPVPFAVETLSWVRA